MDADPRYQPGNPQLKDLILDGTKIEWHLDRVRAWERGERIAPITIDMALTRVCNFGCEFCYAKLQENDRSPITKKIIFDFLEDCAEIGVKTISLVSDGRPLEDSHPLLDREEFRANMIVEPINEGEGR